MTRALGTLIAAALVASGCHSAPDRRRSGFYCSLDTHLCPPVSERPVSERPVSERPVSERPVSERSVSGGMPDTDAGSSASSSIDAIPQLTRDDGAAPLPDARRYSAFDLACTRDSQCGPGKCITGECFYGCESDAQCGSGDRCAAETGTRICLPDLNPPVQCTRSAQCGPGALCLNGSCRQSCYQTEECSNLLDRCADGICQPDRRPLGVCVLNQECPAGFVCLDGSCVDGCASSPDGGPASTGDVRCALKDGIAGRSR